MIVLAEGGGFAVLWPVMRIPITKYGLPQAASWPLALIVAMLAFGLPAKVMPVWLFIAGEGVILIILIWCLSFFRDPQRQIPADTDILLSPADGTVTDIEVVTNPAGIEGRFTRIGIFLSIFNVHINRAPCSARVEMMQYKKGEYLNAMKPQSGEVNESNDIIMTRQEAPQDTLIVRQISGAIARRIVCDAYVGKYLGAGEKFGMIKFGSRTELYFPESPQARCAAKPGQKVKAGVSILVRYENG